MKIYHAEIMTMTEKGIIPNGYVTIENGIITAVEAGDPTPEEGDLDAHGSRLLPGFIDAHTHLGIIEDGLDFEGDDCNEQIRSCPSCGHWTASIPLTAALQKQGRRASPP